jgi:hypothetical protein
MDNLKKYIIRGHGASALPNRPNFKLNNSQYVIFPVKCGASSDTMSSTNLNVKKYIVNPSLVYNVMKRTATNVPKSVKNMRILGPGMNVMNSYLELMNNTRVPSDPTKNQLHRWYNKSSGIHEYKPAINRFKYQSGHGTKGYLSNIIRGKPGVFYVNACRVVPGTTQRKSNENIRKTQEGKPVSYSRKIRRAQIKEDKQLGIRTHSTHLRRVLGSGLGKNPESITSGLLKRKQPPPGSVLGVVHGSFKKY